MGTVADVADLLQPTLELRIPQLSAVFALRTSQLSPKSLMTVWTPGPLPATDWSILTGTCMTSPWCMVMPWGPLL